MWIGGHIKKPWAGKNREEASMFSMRTMKFIIKDVESLLLRIVHPKGNKVAGTFKKKYNLAHRKRNPLKY
jgi:hypothetical protein